MLAFSVQCFSGTLGVMDVRTKIVDVCAKHAFFCGTSICGALKQVLLHQECWDHIVSASC